MSDELGIELVEAVCREGALVGQPVLGELQAWGCWTAPNAAGLLISRLDAAFITGGLTPMFSAARSFDGVPDDMMPAEDFLMFKISVLSC